MYTCGRFVLQKKEEEEVKGKNTTRKVYDFQGSELMITQYEVCFSDQ